jgi:toxin secretion/phage lysis holin
MIIQISAIAKGDETLNEVYAFIKDLIPLRTQIEFGAIISAIGTVFCYVVGPWDGALEALVFAMAIDYISGIMAAYINSGSQLNSQKGFRGICKKIMILLLVSLAHFLDQATGQVIIHSAAIWFFLGNEGLSIVENSAKAGIPIPDKLKNSLEQLNHQREEMTK